MNNDDEIKKLHDFLPTSFFKDTEMLDKHFVKQWFSEKLVKFTLASTSEISDAFARWLLNMTIEQRSININLHESIVHFPSFINFLSNNASLHVAKKKDFFLSFSPSIHKISLGESFLESRDLEMIGFKYFT